MLGAIESHLFIFLLISHIYCLLAFIHFWKNSGYICLVHHGIIYHEFLNCLHTLNADYTANNFNMCMKLVRFLFIQFTIYTRPYSNLFQSFLLNASNVQKLSEVNRVQMFVDNFSNSKLDEFLFKGN